MEYYVSNLLTLIAIYVVLGVSFNLLLGYTGLFSMAHAGFFGIGAYMTAILTKDLGLDFLLAALLGAAVSLLASLGLGFASLRVSGEYLVISSLAFQVLVVEAINNLEVTGRSMGVVGIPRPAVLGFAFDTPLAVLLLAWACAALVTVIAYRLVHSPLGRLLASIREDEVAARSLGKRTTRTKVYVFALTSALAALAGAVFAGHIRFISPAEFGVARSITILSLTIIGGLAAFWGPFVGAAVTVLIPQALTFMNLPPSVAASINAVTYSVLVLLFLLFRPGGILGRAEVNARRGPGRSRGRVAENLAVDAVTAGVTADPPAGGEASPGGALANVLAFPLSRRPAAPSASEPILSAEGLRKSFGGLAAVDGLTIRIREGIVTGLVGPNGAGKTTVFNLLSGFLAPDAGRIRFKGQDVTALSAEERAARGLVRSFQEMRLFGGMTVLDNVLLALTPVGDEGIAVQFAGLRALRRRERERVHQARRILAYLGLGDQADVLARDLSYAEQKLLMMGRLLAVEADCYLLDEPMAGLDREARTRMCGILEELVASGKTVCLIEHNLDVIREVCSWVAFLDQGRLIAEGRPEEIMSNQELTDLYFGT